MPLSKVINKLGQFTGEGGVVPIYGAESLNLEKSNDWKTLDVGIISTVTALWKGDKVVEYPFNFTLYAGVGDITNRDKLYEKMKLMHSWSAHIRNSANNVNSPVTVTLQILGYISCRGSISKITTNAKGPWENQGGIRLPTSCQFSGNFLLMPGYQKSKNDLVVQSKKLSQKQVQSSFYRTSK